MIAAGMSGLLQPSQRAAAAHLPSRMPLTLLLHACFATPQEEEVVEEAPKRGAFAFGTRKMKAAAAEEEEEEEARPARRPFGTQLLGRKEGLATMAERRYAEQQGSRGTQGRGARGGSAPAAPTGTARKSREEIAAERAAAREAAEAERARAREEAARAKAAAEEERRRAREQQ